MAMMKKADAMRRLAGRAWDAAKNKDQFMAMLRSGSIRKGGPSFATKEMQNRLRAGAKARGYKVK